MFYSVLGLSECQTLVLFGLRSCRQSSLPGAARLGFDAIRELRGKSPAVTWKPAGVCFFVGGETHRFILYINILIYNIQYIKLQ